MWFILNIFDTACCLLQSTMDSFLLFLLDRQISDLNLQGEKPFTSKKKNNPKKPSNVKFALVFPLFFIKRALRSLCSCHRLNSRWLCLLNQTHKVPLFHSFTSITHGNRIGFVSVAATSVDMSETSRVKGKGSGKQT